MSADPRITEDDCWWCAGFGYDFGFHTTERPCPFCQGCGCAQHGVSFA